MLSLIPDIASQKLDIFLLSKTTQSTDHFTEFEGVRNATQYVFLPTVETLVFIIIGLRLDLRFQTMRFFLPDHFLKQENMLHIQKTVSSKSVRREALRISST